MRANHRKVRHGKSLEEVGSSAYVGYISCDGPSRGWILVMNLVMTMP